MNTAGDTVMEPEPDREIAGVVVRTTQLVRDGADKDDVRRVFARLVRLKSRCNPNDIYRIECRINLRTFLRGRGAMRHRGRTFLTPSDGRLFYQALISER